ncbi:MAG: hypothetical protein Q9183_006358 [Haloplaca sp. 2 TL-2023]
MVLVSEQPGQDAGALGVVTLEDVIEELIGEEIIDESDVYIDVHKAIRRTNLAPKTKIGKHAANAEPAVKTEHDEDLIDVNDESKPQHKALQRTQSQDQANGALPDAGDAASRRNSLRRTASIASVTKDGQPKPANMDQFRNLGPSNLASRPRTTRYNTVKIKPGGGTLTENLAKASVNAPAGSPLAMSTATPAPHGGVGTGLLSSAGKDASDGVLAIQQGYGTMGTPPKDSGHGGKSSSGGPSAASQAKPASTIPEIEEPTSYQHPNLNPRSPPSRSNSESTIGSLHRRSASGPKGLSPHMRRGEARSGSITENVVDMGGIKKVVLETTSSSEEAVKDGLGEQSEDTNNRGGDAEDDDGEEEDGERKGGGGKKKRRRKNRRKGNGHNRQGGGGAGGDENRPLLERDEE